MKRIDWSYNGGLYTYQETLEFMQAAFTEAIAALGTGFGNKLILHGVNDVGGGNIDNGWVVIDGELMPFIGGPANVQVQVEEVPADEAFDDGSTHTVYFYKRAKMVLVGDFDFADLKPFKTDKLNVDDSDVFASAKTVKQLHDRIMATIPFEDTIILKGCEVTNVTTGPDALEIAAGTVKMGNVIIETAAYIGNYPIWLKEDGSFVLAQPMTGLFIKFDPFTSQGYKAVKRRFDNDSGQLLLFRVDIGCFPGGVGKWEWLGWKICDDMQSRMAIGYDRRVAPADPNYDANYGAVGNFGGAKMHTNTVPEMATHSHGLPTDGGGSSNIPTVLDSANSDEGISNTNQTGVAGGSQPWNIMNPYRVIKFLERI